MANFVAKKAAKHIMKENAENKFGTDDPYFEHVAAVNGKIEKRKRAVPPGLTKQEEKVLKKVTRRAYRLDNCLNICGLRVGWDAVIGLIPAAGDIVSAMLAFMIVWTATGADIPASLKSRMILNIALDFAVGLVPFLGDVADALFRANTRNAALLRKHLQERGAKRLEDQTEGGIRSSSQRRNHQLPGGEMQELKPQLGSRKESRNHEPIVAPKQQSERGRGHEQPLTGQRISDQGARTHSTRGTSRLPRQQDVGPGQTTKPTGSKNKEDGNVGWLGRFAGGSRAEADLENGDRSHMDSRH